MSAINPKAAAWLVGACVAGLMALPVRADDKDDAPKVIKGWGQVSDPDRDCEITSKDGAVEIKVPGKSHDFAAELRLQNSPRVLQEIKGDFIAEVKVSGELKPGGTIVESGPVQDIFNEPRMPYTIGLLGSVPNPELLGKPLTPIHGAPPSLLHPPPGCSFGPRCPLVEPECRTAEPELTPAPSPRHTARCRRWPAVTELEQPQLMFLRPELHHPDTEVDPILVPDPEGSAP